MSKIDARTNIQEASEMAGMLLAAETGAASMPLAAVIAIGPQAEVEAEVAHSEVCLSSCATSVIWSADYDSSGESGTFCALTLYSYFVRKPYGNSALQPIKGRHQERHDRSAASLPVLVLWRRTRCTTPTYRRPNGDQSRRASRSLLLTARFRKRSSRCMTLSLY